MDQEYNRECSALSRRLEELEEENRLLRAREEAARAAYTQLFRHNEEIRMLRHDMKKHFTALRQLAEGGDPRLIQYLDGLLEADAAVRPVVQSGGALLSGLLNGALSRAMDRGADVQILRDEAPSSLPLPDRDLCSLVLNIMDNVLEAVSVPGLEKPCIHLELFTKGAFFFLVVENTRSPVGPSEQTGSENHQGLGLAIVEQIMERNSGMLQIDSEETDRFRVRVALPM